MTLLLTALGAVSSFFSTGLLDHYFDRSNANSYRQEVERVVVAFALERSAMLMTARDNAHWDEAEQFVLGKLPSFVDDNFTADSLRNLNYSAVAVVALDGRIVASRMFTAKGQLVTMPDNVHERLRPLLSRSKPGGTPDAAVSMLWLDGIAFLVAIAPVTDAEQKHEASGYLVFLRKLDRAYLDKLRQITSSSFVLVETAEPGEPQTVAETYRVDGATHWKASTPLAEWPATIVVEGGTRTDSERSASHLMLAGNMLLMVLAALGGTYFILHYRILNRLRQFSRLCDRYHREGNLQLRWPIRGGDELDRLAVSLNELMSKVESQHGNLEHLVEHDPLTGIGNRRLLLNRLAAVQNHVRRGHQGDNSLLLIDLDGFKEINDRLGHAAATKYSWSSPAA